LRSIILRASGAISQPNQCCRANNAGTIARRRGARTGGRGADAGDIDLYPGQRRTVAIARSKGADVLEITSETIMPRDYGVADDRLLGLFVEQIEYRVQAP
jgi:hypothetical protein